MMQLRKAQLKDLQTIISIANLLAIDIPDFIWNKEDFIHKQIERGEYFLIDNGDVAGIMSLRQRQNRMHIETIVVKKEFQKKGFGSMFIDFAKKFTQERGLSVLHAYSFDQYQMTDFYVKKGFKMMDYSGSYNGHKYHCFEMKL